MRIQETTSYAQRMAWLKRCKTHVDLQRERGENPLSLNLRTLLNTLHTDYAEVLASRKASKLRRGDIYAQRDRLLPQMEMLVRDFRDGLKRRTRRKGLPPSSINRYFLSGDGQKPRVQRQYTWVDEAEVLIEAEREAIAEGAEPMSNPSIEELEAVAGPLREVLDQVGAAAKRDGAIQTRLNELTVEVTQLHRDIANQLKVDHSRMTAAVRRNIIRSYGYTYRTSRNTEEAYEEEAAHGEEGAIYEEPMYAEPDREEAALEEVVLKEQPAKGPEWHKEAPAEEATFEWEETQQPPQRGPHPQTSEPEPTLHEPKTRRQKAVSTPPKASKPSRRKRVRPRFKPPARPNKRRRR